MGKPIGERMTAPLAISQAQVSYTKGAGPIHVKVVDSAYKGLMLMPFTRITNMGYERETSDRAVARRAASGLRLGEGH
jgi:hypothetical protein